VHRTVLHVLVPGVYLESCGRHRYCIGLHGAAWGVVREMSCPCHAACGYRSCLAVRVLLMCAVEVALACALPESSRSATAVACVVFASWGHGVVPLLIDVCALLSAWSFDAWTGAMGRPVSA
jgi:hypothetical protein